MKASCEPGTQREKIPMIVIERYGKTIVITGWRAWVIRAVAVVVMTTVLAALAFLVLGIAVSMVAFLLIVMPAVAIVALVAWFFQPRRA
jgi:presenilin-like A22 family membrane protease